MTIYIAFLALPYHEYRPGINWKSFISLLKINILYRFPTFNIILANILVTRPVICTLWIFNTCTLLSTSNMKELGNSPLGWGQLRKIFSIDSTLNLIGIERTPEYTSRLHFSEVESTEKIFLSRLHKK